MKSEFRVFYLDGGTIGGPATDVLGDLHTIEQEASKLGFQLNLSKSELIGSDQLTSSILQASPDLRVVNTAEATLLGSPIGHLSSLDRAITDKLDALRTMRSRLCLLRKLDALLLLRHSLAIPKILYTLRTSPSFTSSRLALFDCELRSTLSEVLNIRFDNDMVWTQASLPVKAGGIGVRSAAQLAPSAFLSSLAGTAHLVELILPENLKCDSAPEVQQALMEWSKFSDVPPPPSPADQRQRAWDGLQVEFIHRKLVEAAPTPRDRARLLAAATKESGAWLNAPPSTCLGLRLKDEVVRISVGLRLGAPLSFPHQCRLCGTGVDAFATHGLSCIKSEGRHSRHAALNHIVKCSLAAAQIPAALEPNGLCREDGNDQMV